MKTASLSHTTPQSVSVTPQSTPQSHAGEAPIDAIDRARLEAIYARARELLDHLQEAPAIAAALPFTVTYLVARLREALADRLESRPGRR